MEVVMDKNQLKRGAILAYTDRFAGLIYLRALF
jgi:hypothetical protein